MAVVQLRKTVHGMWAAPSKCVEQKNWGGVSPQFFGILVGNPRILGGPVEPCPTLLPEKLMTRVQTEGGGCSGIL